MPYDPDTLMRRYRQMLEVVGSDGDHTLGDGSEQGASSPCAWCEQTSEDRKHSDDPDGCQSCCVGLVERVKQYSEKVVQVETLSETLDDTWTKARKLNPSGTPSGEPQ